jgi:hypothetical protein
MMIRLKHDKGWHAFSGLTATGYRTVCGINHPVDRWDIWSGEKAAITCPRCAVGVLREPTG